MGKKNIYSVPTWLTTNPNKNRFSKLYDDMVFSPAFLSLTNNQKLLLICMQHEYNPSTKAKHPDNNVNEFYFNRSIYKKKYGLYSNDNQFYRDRDALIKKGFIIQVKGGYTTREKTVYKFSDRWQRWNGTDFELNSNERTGSMMKWGRHTKE
ncbi:MAG: hypothetical protein J1E96_04525 [Ruminococcus sp.]|nr:hypothetical protein [Ruminococcus sp.]